MSPRRRNGIALVRAILPLAACLAAGAPGSAQPPLIAPIFQERYVDAYAVAYAGSSNDADGDHVAAPDLGPFDSGIGVSAHASDTNGGALAISSAVQSSVIGTDSIQASGSVGYGIYIAGSDAGASIAATSKTVVTFLLLEDSEYLLQGTLNAYAARSSLRLDGPAGPVHHLSGFGELIPAQETGTLPAGEYTFEVKSWVEDGAWGSIQLNGGSEHDVALRFGPIGFGGPGGEVPDGKDVPGGPPLQVDRLPDGFVRLTWGPSCRLGDGDYAVYEGELEDSLHSMRVTCSTEGQRTHEFQPTAEGAWFVVVPTDGETEGSYGDTSDGIERPPSASACVPQMLGDPVCP